MDHKSPFEKARTRAKTCAAELALPEETVDAVLGKLTVRSVGNVQDLDAVDRADLDMQGTLIVLDSGDPSQGMRVTGARLLQIGWRPLASLAVTVAQSDAAADPLTVILPAMVAVAEFVHEGRDQLVLGREEALMAFCMASHGNERVSLEELGETAADVCRSHRFELAACRDPAAAIKRLQTAGIVHQAEDGSYALKERILIVPGYDA